MEKKTFNGTEEIDSEKSFNGNEKETVCGTWIKKLTGSSNELSNWTKEWMEGKAFNGFGEESRRDGEMKGRENSTGLKFFFIRNEIEKSKIK